MFRWTEW